MCVIRQLNSLDNLQGETHVQEEHDLGLDWDYGSLVYVSNGPGGGMGANRTATGGVLHE